jgi:hypothetical protein
VPVQPPVESGKRPFLHTVSWQTTLPFAVESGSPPRLDKEGQRRVCVCVCVCVVDEAHPWLACLVKITVPPVFAAHLHHRLRMLAWWVSSVLYSL